MKRLHIFQTLSYIALFGFFTTYLSAQNLVVNPSFENTNTNCSNFGGEGYRTDLDPTWDNANSNIPGDSCSSPDLFSACNIFAVGMPSSIMGWQYARTGTRYTGIILYEAPFGIKSNYREYIQGHTTSPMVAGNTYCVSFYVSLGDAVQYASENIGVYFSNTHFSRDACADGALINVTPQLTNDCGVIMDTTNWVRLQWNYTAVGGEKYFVIGNFKDKNNTPIHNAYGGILNPYAYYFIDDVSIVDGTCCYAEIDPINAPCINDAPTNLTASQGVGCSLPSPSGTWSGPGITNASTGTFDPSTAGIGTHIIKFTLDCGYEVTSSITVKGCDMEVCIDNDGDYTVSDGTGPYTWSEWSSGSTTTVTDKASCISCGGNWTFGQCFSSGFPPSPISSCTAPPDYVEYATGDKVPASSNFPVIVVDATGDTLTINDASEITSCTSCPTINITTSNVTDASCGGSNGTATVLASGGTGSYTYNWQPGNLNGATQTILSSGIYTVTATDINGCNDNIDVVIGGDAGASISIDNVTSVSCNGESDGSAKVNVSSGQSPYSYSWDNGETTATVSNLNAGNHTVTVTDGNDCISSESVDITEPDAIALITSATDATCGNNDGNATVTATGGKGTLHYQWDDPLNQTTAIANNLSNGSYEVTVTDDNGCSVPASVTVHNSDGPSVAVINVTDVSCNGNADGSIKVEVNDGTLPYTFSWSSNGSTSENATNLSAGDYTVTVTDDAGCSDNLQITIAEPDAIAITEIITDANCGQNNGSVALQVTGGDGNYTYTWNPNVSTTATSASLADGIYNVTVTDGSGCTQTGAYTVGMNGSFYLNIIPEGITIHQGESIDIHLDVDPSITVDSIIWSPAKGLSCTDCLDPVASPEFTTTYYVEVISTDGCSSMDSITVTVKSPCAKIYVPTSFSPNGDGMNDLECIMGDCIATLDFTIYNRWGEVVFQTADKKQCWDGLFRGKLVQTGVYVYKLRATLESGKKIEDSGNINVVR